MNFHGLMFHHFHAPGQRFGQGSITAETFARMIEYIGKSNILPAQEWYKRAVSNMLRPNETCLTFDDNLKCQYEVALPVLEHYGLQAFFFIYSSVCEGNIENLEVYRVFRSEYFKELNDFHDAFEETARAYLEVHEAATKLKNFRHQDYLKPFAFYTTEDKRFRFIRDEILGPENYFAVIDSMIAQRNLSKGQLSQNLWMNDANLRELSGKGHMIGLHSYSHPTRLAHMPVAEQKEEYRRNYEHILKATNAAPVSMSHPVNSYNSSTLAILQELGIRIGFCSNMSEVKGRSLLEIPRIDHADLLRKIAA